MRVDGSEDSSDSSGQGGDTSAPAGTADGTAASADGGQGGAGGDSASQKVSAAIEQAMESSPVTFTPESAELSEPAKGSLQTIAQAIVSTLEGFGVTKDRIDTEATGNEKVQGAEAMKTQITVT